jgi:hypothetical protein
LKVLLWHHFANQGTPLHYLPAENEVSCLSCPALAAAALIFRELAATGRPVHKGKDF